MDRSASSPAPTRIQTWHAHIDDVLGDDDAIDRARHWLSDAECARYERYRFDADRRMFVLGRLMARVLVGRALGVPAQAWPWREGTRGRPEVDVPAPPVCFNLAHSAGVVACAISPGPVGVDIEHRHRRPIDERLIRRFCAPREIAAIEATAPAIRQDQFLRYWTLKEAYLKALGLGIAVHLADISFTIAPQGIRVDFLNSLAGRSTAWAFHLTAVDDEHFIAVAAPADLDPEFVVERLAATDIFE